MLYCFKKLRSVVEKYEILKELLQSWNCQSTINHKNLPR